MGDEKKTHLLLELCAFAGYIVCTIQSRKTAAGQKIQLTKELTIFDSGIDPNPVFRSFLLQLIMRTR